MLLMPRTDPPETAFGSDEGRQLNIVIPVWGERYVAALTEFALPFLLSPGNIPGLRRPDLVTLRLVTAPGTIGYLEAHPSIRHARRSIQVDVTAFPLSFPERMTHLPLFSQVFVLEIERARERGEDVVCLCADSVVADGGLKSVEQQRAAGWRCMYTCGHRVKQTELVAWSARYRDGTGAITVPPRDLVRFSIQAQHEWTERLAFGNGVVDEVPGFFWMDRRSNFLGTSLMLHPLYLDTRAVPGDFAQRSVTSIDGDVPAWLDCRPEEIHVFQDSDQFFAFEFSEKVALPVRKEVPGGVDAWLAAWADSVCTYIRRNLAARPGLGLYLRNLEHTIRCHSDGLSGIDPEIEALAGRLMGEVRQRLDAWAAADETALPEG